MLRRHSRSWELVALGSVVEDMQLHRFVSLVDLRIATVVVVTIVLRAREMFAGAAHTACEGEQVALGVAVAPQAVLRPRERALRQIHPGGRDMEGGSATPAPGSGSSR